jgi:hypothetical protein
MTTQQKQMEQEYYKIANQTILQERIKQKEQERLHKEQMLS